MKTSLFMICFLISLSAYSQRLDFSMGLGTGKAYFIESIDYNVDVKYSMPLLISSELKFTPKDRNAGVKFRLQNFQSTVEGKNWTDFTNLDGQINNLNASLLLENELRKGKYSVGYNFGFGISREHLKPVYYKNEGSRTLYYPTATLGGLFAYKLSKSSAIQIQPMLFCSDPYNGIVFLTTNSATIAREDISGLITFGFTYNLLSDK